MNISSNFNRFYHKAVLTELFRKANTLKFHKWVDTETGQVLMFERGEHYGEMDELKQLLKNMNVDYAVNGNEKVSTSDIDSKALSQHIEYTIRLAGLNGIEFSFVEQQWALLLQQAHNYRR